MTRLSASSAVVALVILITTIRTAAASPDSLYRAGTMQGRHLYWVPQITNLPLDTVGWQESQQIALNREPDSTRSLRQALPGIRTAGVEVYRLDKPSAIVIALIRQMGYPVLLLTQWHGALKEKVIVPRPGLVQSAFRHTVLSEYIWEFVDRCELTGKTPSADDLRIRMFYREAGFCEYNGKDEAQRVDRQMLGVQGFSVFVRESDYSEDMGIMRRIFGVYLIADAKKKPADLQKEIEKAMDRQKLDLSYRLPEIKVVK